MWDGRRVSSRWAYSVGTAEAVLAAVVGASVALTGFVVTVSVLIVQMATGTFSARYMRLFYRDGLLKAVLAVLVGTLTFSYWLLRRVEQDSVPGFGVTLAGLLLVCGVLLFLFFLDRSIHRLRPVAVASLVAGAAGERSRRPFGKRRTRTHPSSRRTPTSHEGRRTSSSEASSPAQSRPSTPVASSASPANTTV